MSEPDLVQVVVGVVFEPQRVHVVSHVLQTQLTQRAHRACSIQPAAPLAPLLLTKASSRTAFCFSTASSAPEQRHGAALMMQREKMDNVALLICYVVLFVTCGSQFTMKTCRSCLSVSQSVHKVTTSVCPKSHSPSFFSTDRSARFL